MTPHTCPKIVLALACWMAVFTTSGFAREDLIRDIIQTKVEHIRDYTPLYVGDAVIASTTLLPDIYERNRFKPLWIKPESIAAYITRVEKIKTHGLEPSDYHAAYLAQFRTAVRFDDRNPWLISDFDLLLTDSVIRLLYHLFYGKVEPRTLHPEWNFYRALNGRDPARIILEAIQTDTLIKLIDSLTPKHTSYQRLLAALARYREIQDQNRWVAIPSGPTMTKGMRGNRVALLCRRLTITGDLAQTGQGRRAGAFDDAVAQAVIRFQKRHGLEADGIVDRITLDELNQPVDVWIDQIKANLERARWVLHDLPGRFVVIDICGYMAHLYNADEIELSTRIQVGQPYRQTPTFKSAIKYMVLNPTWTIPPGVLSKDILPESYRNPKYFEEQGISIYDRSGRQVQPDAVDLKNYNTNSFKYRFVQNPRGGNPLGRIKFILPNRHFIFLHDTTEKEAFDENWRAFSSGCIRVENPLIFAVALMNDSVKWSPGKFRSLAASGATRTVHLPEPVPIMLLYLTVVVDEKGLVLFREDVYQRDRNVIDGLDQPFVFRSRP